MGVLTEFLASFEAFQTFAGKTALTGFERLSFGDLPTTTSL